MTRVVRVGLPLGRAGVVPLWIVLLAGCAAVPPSVTPSAGPPAPGSAAPIGRGSDAAAPPAAATQTAIELIGTRWIVRTIGGRPVVAGSPPTVEFLVGEIRVSGGCNGGSADVQVDPTSGELRIGGIGRTEMACAAQDGTTAVMTIEQLFFDAMPTVRRASLDESGRLVLDGGGVTIVLVRHT